MHSTAPVGRADAGSCDTLAYRAMGPMSPCGSTSLLETSTVSAKRYPCSSVHPPASWRYVKVGTDRDLGMMRLLKCEIAAHHQVQFAGRFLEESANLIWLEHS